MKIINKNTVPLIFTISIFILITACKDQPVASFTFSPSAAEVGDTVYFQSTSQNANTFDWDFGDGNSSIEENPEHIYAEIGTYTVSLIVTNTDGSDEANGAIVIMIPSGQVIYTSVFSQGLEGNLLGDSPYRDASIYLPPGYEIGVKNYPAVYLLHGYPAGYEIWIGWGSDLNLDATMDRLIYEGIIEPMILVAPDSRNRFYGSFYINSVVSGNWQDFIVQDLVQFVDNNYRTIPNPESRGIAGHSLGGYGTILIAMIHPEIFSTAYALSSWGLKFELGTPADINELRLIYEEIAECNKISDFEKLSDYAKLSVASSVAMVPNPSAPPFYCDLLFDTSGEIVDSVLQKFDRYDPSKLVPLYESNLLQLNAIKLDCGNADDNKEGNIYFASKLADIGIQNTFESYSGDHTNKIAERLGWKVLPYFSKNLVHED